MTTKSYITEDFNSGDVLYSQWQETETFWR